MPGSVNFEAVAQVTNIVDVLRDVAREAGTAA